MGVFGAGGVVGPGSDALSVVNHGGEYEHTQRQEDDEQEEFIDAGPQRVAQDAQPYKVPRQLEDPKDSNKTHHAQEAQHVAGGLGGQPTQAHLQVERQNGHKVNDVEGVPDEDHLVRAADDAHQELKGEPDHTDALHQGENRLGHNLRPVDFMCDVAFDNMIRPVLQCVEGLMGLQTEGGDGNQDEKERGKRHALRETDDREKQSTQFSIFHHTEKHHHPCFVAFRFSSCAPVWHFLEKCSSSQLYMITRQHL